MDNENHPKVKIISDCFVKPKFEIDESKTPYYLSSKDLFHLSTTYMHRGLLYAKPSSSSSSISFNINSFVDNLKQSLSIALVDFYPLSGRLETVKYPEDHSSWVYVDCNKGPGARFIHASLVRQGVLTLSNIVTCHESIPRFLWCLFDAGDPNVVNYDGHTRALVTVQVTDLVDGVFIGFTMNHSLADGTSLWCFLNNLSNIFMNRINNVDRTNNNNNNNNNNIEKPIFKSVFSDGYGPILKIPYFDPSEFIVRYEKHPRLRTRIFHFSAEAIARIKARANEKSNGIIISSFQALSAFTWISITRARNQPDDSIAMCLIPATTRPKFDPPLPSNHFGNFANSVISTSKVNDLLQNGLGWASIALHEAIMGQDKTAVQTNLKARDEAPQVGQVSKMYEYFGDYPPLLITSTGRFDTYGPEFGLGKPVASRPGNSNALHGLIVADPGREGGGSVNLNVCLLTKVIDVLECDHEFMSYVS